jgi:NADH-quinone oxidoreductase subunit A
MGSLTSYLPIFLMIVLGGLFAALSFVASSLLAPKRPNAAKEAPYECGIVPTHEPSHRFPVRFYLIAMIFIIFDIEIIFLFPWAIVFGDLGAFGLIEILVFSAAVFISLVYLISNGALDWGPIKRVRALPVAEQRTSTSTVRRVGADQAPSSPSGEAA